MSSDTQFDTLKWSYAFSGSLSVAGSAIIMWHAVHKLHRPYHRILFMLSVTDLICSLSLAIMPLAFYRPNLKPSAVCELDGFIVISMGYSSAFYNASLSMYFLLTIKYSYSERKMAQKVEPFLHGVSVMYPLTCAIIGLVLQMYNPSPGSIGCWINAYPKNCEWDEDIECERGEGAYMFSFFAAVIPLALVWIALIGNNVAIYCFVRRIEERSNQHAASSTLSRFEIRSRQSDEDEMEKELAKAAPNPGLSSADTHGVAIIPLAPPALPLSIRRNASKNFAKTRQTAVQSFFYVFAYFVVFFFGSLAFCFKTTDPDGFQSGKYFPLQVLDAFFFPLQGFFDAIIYFRPRYYRFRKYFPEKSRWFALREAVCTRATPAEAEASVKRRHMSGAQSSAQESAC